MTFASFGKIRSIASRIKIRSALSVTYAVRQLQANTRWRGTYKARRRAQMDDSLGGRRNLSKPIDVCYSISVPTLKGVAETTNP